MVAGSGEARKPSGDSEYLTEIDKMHPSTSEGALYTELARLEQTRTVHKESVM